MQFSKKHVTVLKGGWSGEREVSLRTAQGVEEALKELGHDVSSIDVPIDPIEFLKLIKALPKKPDVFFVALHGKGVEDGTFQGFLNLIGIPYTHSGVLASSLAMDKVLAKQVFLGVGIPTLPSYIFDIEEIKSRHVLPPPYVVKPINEGSSLGVFMVYPGEEPPSLEGWVFGKNALVETFIAGREVSVGVMGKGDQARALGVMEIAPKTNSGFFDFQAKYVKGCATFLMPAPLSKEKYEEVMHYGLLAHKALGCRGVTRTDFRLEADTENPEKKFWILETNTIPGMTPVSQIPQIAAYKGITYAEIVQELIETAQCDEISISTEMQAIASEDTDLKKIKERLAG